MHQKCVNSIYGSLAKNLSTKERVALGLDEDVYSDMTVRAALGKFAFRWTHTIGLVILDICGVTIGPRPTSS